MSYTANLENDKTRHVGIPAGNVQLDGELQIPVGASGLVLFAHGSGSSRHSPRNQFVEQKIRQAGIGTLLFDLLTREEEAVDLQTRHLRFDIGLLAERLVGVVTGLMLYLNYKTLPADLRPSWFAFAVTALAGLFFAAFAVIYLVSLIAPDAV